MQKKVLVASFSFIILLSLFGCDTANRLKLEPVARVHDKYLYVDDIMDIFPENIAESDSLQILKAYVDRWVRKQLLLYRAEKNLTEKQKNVTQQLEDYRSSLLIFKYEQEFIRQKLDTVITFTEIEEFYNENTSNFILNESIVKALFIKVRLDEPYYERIASLYQSSNEDDIVTLDNLSYQVAIKYDYFNEQWVSFSTIMRELPEPIANPETFLLRNRSLEMNDGTFAYLVNIRDVLHRGQQSPLSYERGNIRNILLNKRKQILINDLETRIYNDARNYNHFKVFLD